MKKYMTIGNMFGRTVKTACQGGLSSFVLSLFHLFTLSLLLSSCCMIDEDRDNCPKRVRIDYELHLQTNWLIELRTQLDSADYKDIAGALREHLKDIFSDFAHDLDLSFYDTQGDSARLFHDKDIMDATQCFYSIEIPVRQYMHLALANIVDNQQVSFANDEHCHPSMLRQAERDTVGSHTTGVFTARQPMAVKEDDQTFKVWLYMANCATALVIDPRGHSTEGMRVYTTGFATGISLCDSAYHFAPKAPIMRTTRLDGGGRIGFCSVNFPSRELEQTRTVIQTEEPFLSQEGDEELWEYRAYVPKPQGGGSITETILRFKKPLRAGQLKIVKGWIDDDGVVRTGDTTVGVSVTLDWSDAGHHEVPL